MNNNLPANIPVDGYECEFEAIGENGSIQFFPSKGKFYVSVESALLYEYLDNDDRISEKIPQRTVLIYKIGQSR